VVVDPPVVDPPVDDEPPGATAEDIEEIIATQEIF
jgi:hypothetical protein